MLRADDVQHPKEDSSTIDDNHQDEYLDISHLVGDQGLSVLPPLILSQYSPTPSPAPRLSGTSSGPLLDAAAPKYYKDSADSHRSNEFINISGVLKRTLPEDELMLAIQNAKKNNSFPMLDDLEEWLECRSQSNREFTQEDADKFANIYVILLRSSDPVLKDIFMKLKTLLSNSATDDSEYLSDEDLVNVHPRLGNR